MRIIIGSILLALIILGGLSSLRHPPGPVPEWSTQ